MKCEILMSVMNQKNKDEILKRLSVRDVDDCLIVNQVTDGVTSLKNDMDGNHKFLSYKEKGLSRSRNHAIENATGDICIIADDDTSFVGDYKKIIINAYGNHPDADIISFDFVQSDGMRESMSEGKVDYLRSMKLSSTQITFRRKSIIDNGVKFDENFGTGSGKYNWGEENIFLFDCLRAGLRIYHIPNIIIVKSDFGTTWDKSNTVEHFEQQGAIYYRMSPKYWRVLVLQFVLRKRKIYGRDMTSVQVFNAMYRGAKKYKKEFRND